MVMKQNFEIPEQIVILGVGRGGGAWVPREQARAHDAAGHQVRRVGRESLVWKI